MYIKPRKSPVKFRVLAVTALLFIGMISVPAKSSADSLSNLQNQLASYQKQQQQLQDTLDSQKAELKTQKQQEDAVNQQVQITQNEINNLNAQVSGLNTQIAGTQQQITAKQQQIDNDYNLYKQRLRAMYESGDESYVVALLASNDFSEFLSRVELVQVVSKQDQELVNNLKAEKAQLTTEQTNLQTQLANLQSSQQTLTAKQQVLSSQKAQAAALVTQKQNAVNTTTQQKSAVDEEATLTQQQIDAINAEIEREAEAARASNPEITSASAASVIAFAERYTGTSYVFGSANPSNGIDCSGLTQYVFANAAGIYLPHQAISQANYGTAVSKNNLQPGDLVFFATEGGRTITHVGIYIGNDAFIGAQTSTGVAIVKNMFESSYWGPDYVTARRLLNN